MLEEFEVVKGGNIQARRLIDGVIVLNEATAIHESGDFDISGKDIIVIQTKAGRLGMYLLGQAFFSAMLINKHKPRSVRTVAICGKSDAVLEVLAKDHGIEIVVID